ncbi:MAG: ABC transporter substrate-binding protein [Acidimicrobiales bacterium]
MRTSRWKALLSLLFAFSLVAAACSGDESSEGSETASADLAGTEVIITGPERSEQEVGAIQAAMDIFAEENEMTITYTGSADWETEVNVQVEAGNPPDISIFPQPGKLADFYRDGSLQALPDDVVSTVDEYWTDAWTVFGNVDGTQVGVPVKTDIKSLVWYKPAAFEAGGYEIPTTFDEFVALAEQMIADGETPLCVGIESGDATGWPFTDWVEEMMLRFEGVEVYDQWVNHEIPFNDERVVAQMQAVLDLWNTDGMVYADGGTIASTAFQANGTPLVEGDCMMHRQASFFSNQFDEGTVFADGSEDAVDVFYFPSNEGAPVLGAGTLAAGFRDAPEVYAVLNYMASGDYANNRQQAQRELNGGDLSGFLTANSGVDLDSYAPLEQSMISSLTGADVVRFDASDLMPSDVGAGTFWSEGTAAVNGEQDAQEAADKIEASWPA